jgi:hypothetical protein
MKRHISICATILILFSSYALAGTWTTLDYQAHPSGVFDADGSNVTGCYVTSGNPISVSHGFIYDGANWTTLDAPDSTQTYAWGISGKNVVGYYASTGVVNTVHTGFIFDGTNWTSLYAPDGLSTNAWGIDGTKVVGDYYGWLDSSTHGYIYESTTQSWTTLDNPSASTWNGSFTSIRSIEGNNAVGYSNGAGSMPYQFSFLYDGTNWTNFYYPGAQVTQAYGISGDYIVGYYRLNSSTVLNHGFIYDRTKSSWTVLDYPGAAYTQVYGISGDTIVGMYVDATSYSSHGFVYTIPEPATLLLFGLGAAVVRKSK